MTAQSLALEMAATLANRRPELARALREIDAQCGPEASAWQKRANANFARMVSESTVIELQEPNMNAALAPSDLEQWCAELRTADGIKRLLRTEISDSNRRMLEDLLYAAGRIDGLREANERVSV